MKQNRNEEPVFISRRAEQQHSRMEALKMLRFGLSVKDVAAYFGVTQRAVYHWITIFAESGQNGLMAKNGAGRKPKLDSEKMWWLARTVSNNTPDQLKFDFGLWTLRLIGELIERQFGIRLSKPTLGKIMAHLGFTPQRPLHRAYQQDAVLVEKWRSEELPALQKRAQVRGARIMFADEASMRTDYHAGTTWAPRGRTPIVGAAGQRVSVNMISAIGLNGELEFMMVDGYGTGTTFKWFLEQLMLGASKPIILVVDGCSIHKANEVKEYVESTKGKLELYFLPPYSPQLNPDEQVWKNVKEYVAKQFPKNRSQLREMLKKALERLQSMPEIVKGFFRHPDCGFVK
jgi:transposase